MQNTLEAWTTAVGVAEHLAISDATLQGWVADRGVPVHRIGHSLRFGLAEVDAWFERGGLPNSSRKGCN